MEKLILIKEIDIEEAEEAIVYTKNFCADGSIMFQGKLIIEDIKKVYTDEMFYSKEFMLENNSDEDMESITTLAIRKIKENIIKKIIKEYKQNRKE